MTVGTENGNPIELHYEDVGAGSPDVLIHGWPLSGESWEHPGAGACRGWSSRGHLRPSRFRRVVATTGRLRLRHLHGRPQRPVGAALPAKRHPGRLLDGRGEVALYIGVYGTERVAKAVLAYAVPDLYKSADNPDGGLDDAERAIAQFEEGVKSDRLAFLDEFATNFFTAGKELKVSESERSDARDVAAAASPKGTLDCIAAFGRTDSPTMWPG